MNFNFKNASGGVRNRNKGAISLEYILVIVVVVLVCLVGMKIFGSKIGETINNSKDAIVSTTDNVFNQLGGTASGGSGGSGSTGGVDMPSINVTDGSTVLAAGDFSTKGNLVTINDTQYRVLSVDGTQVKVMSMADIGSSVFNSSSVTTSFGDKNGQKYADSNLDQTMTNYYNSLPETIKKAIVPQTIKQSMYLVSNLMRLDNKKAEIEVGQRYVYALDVDDVIEYLGNDYSAGKYVVNKMFFDTTSTVSRGIWLRSANSDYSDYAFGVYGNYDCLDYRECGSSSEVRPAFILDLNLLS